MSPDPKWMSLAIVSLLLRKIRADSVRLRRKKIIPISCLYLIFSNLIKFLLTKELEISFDSLQPHSARQSPGKLVLVSATEYILKTNIRFYARGGNFRGLDTKYWNIEKGVFMLKQFGVENSGNPELLAKIPSWSSKTPKRDLWAIRRLTGTSKNFRWCWGKDMENN